MAGEDQSVHFVLFAQMGQGHILPMVDIGKLLAQQGVIVSIIVTSKPVAGIQKTVDRAKNSGLQIHLLPLKIPADRSGLLEGYENLDRLPPSEHLFDFFTWLYKLKQPAEELFRDLKPKPNCIISDSSLPWTVEIASKFQTPWISFFGGSCFCPVVFDKIFKSTILSTVTSDEQHFTVPDLPDRIDFMKAQLPATQYANMIPFFNLIDEAENKGIGSIMNSFVELEQSYVERLKKLKKNVWCVGPVSLCNKNDMDKTERGGHGHGQGSSAIVDGENFLKWLDSQKTGSVIYACLGSLCNLETNQLIELGLGLEASNRPFVWVLKQNEELEKWVLESGFEERIKGKEKGVLIRGWAPQVMILSHSAIGGFLTHCGWNSILEGISAGVPMATWPMFSEQFLNEKQIVNVLKIAVRIGAKFPVKWGLDKTCGVQVKSGDVKEAIDELMGEGDEAQSRRMKAKKLSEMAEKAMGDGGSSQINIKLLIHQIKKITIKNNGALN